MLNKKLPLSETRTFSNFFLDYLEHKQNLQPFFHRFPSPENFKGQLNDKSTQYPDHHRNVLAGVLEQQYAALEQSTAVKTNIAALREKNTFTITTGHQLNIFTGPLYFIYKIVTVINACRKLKSRYPDYNFVPVYWMASEDHDFDEIKYFWLYGKKYVWQTEQKGAVGRFKTDDLRTLISEIPGEIAIFRDAYLKHKSLAEAVRYYVNALFGAEGLLVVEPDDHHLKSLFKTAMTDDIIAGSTLQLVEGTNRSLEELQYRTQVYCRDINFFYLDDQLRNRIEKKNGEYHVLETNLRFSEKEMASQIETSPEKFSPNVVLRPLYQECILPNLAYVGGPAEVTYWLQLKGVFNKHRIPFPILMPRNFALVVEAHIQQKFEKTGLDLQMLFEEKNFIFNHWTLKNTKHNLTVGPERNTISGIFQQLGERAASIDKTLEPFVGAEGKRAMNSLEKIERKLLRAEKRFQSDKLRQIESVKDALFPDGGLQERHDNFLNFYQQDNLFISRLLKNFDPFDFKFNVLIYTPV